MSNVLKFKILNLLIMTGKTFYILNNFNDNLFYSLRNSEVNFDKIILIMRENTAKLEI